MARCIPVSLLLVLIITSSSEACRHGLCTVCGYHYDAYVGDPDNGVPPGSMLEELPYDWVCPVCGSPPILFECIDMGTCKRPILSALDPVDLCHPPECDGIWILEFEFGNCGGACYIPGNLCLSDPNKDITAGIVFAAPLKTSPLQANVWSI